MLYSGVLLFIIISTIIAFLPYSYVIANTPWLLLPLPVNHQGTKEAMAQPNGDEGDGATDDGDDSTSDGQLQGQIQEEGGATETLQAEEIESPEDSETPEQEQDITAEIQTLPEQDGLQETSPSLQSPLTTTENITVLEGQPIQPQGGGEAIPYYCSSETGKCYCSTLDPDDCKDLIESGVCEGETRPIDDGRECDWSGRYPSGLT